MVAVWSASSCFARGRAMKLPTLMMIAAAITAPLDVHAAEIKVLCVGGVQSALSALVPRFEAVSGHRVAISYVSPGGALRDRVLAAQDVDVALAPSPVLGAIAVADRIVPGSLIEIARTPLAVGVRAGAAKPDLSSPDAVRRAV